MADTQPAVSRATPEQGGPPAGRADIDEGRHRALLAVFREVFGHDPDVVVRAPGRNTAIGDHLDYPPLPQDGSASSQTVAWATKQNVLVAAAHRSDQVLKLYAVNEGQTFTFNLDDLERLATEASKRDMRDVQAQPLFPWAMSTLALLYSSAHGRQGIRASLPLHGAEFAIEGNLPQGAGQSSSAALLVGITLACNELFSWGIPRNDAFTLADIARSGEHEEYSPFIRKGRAGYLDQMTILTAREGKAVAIDHGNYANPEWLNLDAVENHGYRNVIVLSGLSRALGETDYVVRVDELGKLPAKLNAILAHHHAHWVSKTHIHQFTSAEWLEAKEELEAEEPILARRARYVFEERERTARFRRALDSGRMHDVIRAVNESGAAMSMDGPYQISGYNHVPKDNRRIAALDTLRDIVLRHAGSGSAARLIGGGGAGPLYVLAPASVAESPEFAAKVVADWYDAAGLTARVLMDTPARGADVVWRRPSQPH